MESERVSKFIEPHFRAFCCRFTTDAGYYFFFLNISHNHYKMDFVYKTFCVCYFPICVAE